MQTQKAPVLSQYTIRSKQEYIFKTNKIVEIAGASSHIRDAWDYLFTCAEKLGKKTKRQSGDKYDHKEVLSKFEDGSLQMIELFCGGGNETILFDCKDTYLEVNREFSYYLLKECPGMIPMATCVEASDDYKADYQRLMAQAEYEKNRMISGQDTFILPFSMMDRDIFKPMTKLVSMDGKPKYYSDESLSKREKGIKERNKDDSIKKLDYMVTKKGDESLLAVVHADGNNMGSKIMGMLDGKTSYDECVNTMRVFTAETANVFSVHGLKAVENKKNELENRKKLKKEKLAYRVIIKDGDDMTFICNARYVMEYVEAYIKAVQEYEADFNYSSCAGICIFHSHYPFSQAYSIAEQACDGEAKIMVHKVDDNGKVIPVEEGWVDFHYIHSGIGGNLQEIRQRQKTTNCMARPWMVAGKSDSVYKIDSLYEMDRMIKKRQISRSTIKTIGELAEESKEIGLRELNKLYNRLEKDDTLKAEMEKLFGCVENQLKAFYDYAEVYDLWFNDGV